MGHETVSMKERFRKGFIPWDEVKEYQKNTRVDYWKQWYHKPYQCDWYEATQKATLRVWKQGDMK